MTAICTGAFILAEAGLLRGRRATTHWYYARELQRSFPDIKVEEDRIFIIDAPNWTSAGATAGLDIALAMVEKDLGSEVARISGKKAGDAASARGRSVSTFGITYVIAEIGPHSKRAVPMPKGILDPN